MQPTFFFKDIFKPQYIQALGQWNVDKGDVYHTLAETLRTKQSFVIDPMYKISNYWEPAAIQWWSKWGEKTGNICIRIADPLCCTTQHCKAINIKLIEN